MQLKVIGSSSKGNCYILGDENEKLIIELGVSFKTVLKALNYNTKNVSGCLVSHSHKDHSKEVKTAINRGLNIYSSLDMFAEIGENITNRTKILNNGKKIKIGGFTVLPFSLIHDVTNFGFLIKHENLGLTVFINDTSEVNYKINNVENFIIEANYDIDVLCNSDYNDALIERVENSHLDIKKTVDFLKENTSHKHKNTILIHLSDSNSNEIDFIKQCKQVTGVPTFVAKKNITLELK